MLEIVPIPGLPLYGASRDGAIWSKKRKGPGRDAEAAEWHRLKTSKYKRTGYRYLQLQVGDQEKTFLVHKLIALTFLGPRPEGLEINHKDGDKDNNSNTNLEYITYHANLEHAWANNLIVIGKPKLTHAQVDEIRGLIATHHTDTEISKIFLVYPTSIRDIRLNKTWKTTTESRVFLSAA